MIKIYYEVLSIINTENRKFSVFIPKINSIIRGIFYFSNDALYSLHYILIFNWFSR